VDAVMPVEAANGNGSHNLAYKGRVGIFRVRWTARTLHQDDRVMLIRNRKSRIYFLRQFFDYPIQLSAQTLKGLGLIAHRQRSASAIRRA
jgi:hypothetical protein